MERAVRVGGAVSWSDGSVGSSGSRGRDGSVPSELTSVGDAVFGSVNRGLLDLRSGQGAEVVGGFETHFPGVHVDVA